MSVASADAGAHREAARRPKLRMPAGTTLLGAFGVLISIFITAGFLAYHLMWYYAAQCPPYASGCVYPTPAQVSYTTLVQGLGLLFVILFDLALGLSVAMAFLSSTRSDIPDGTRRSLYLFATVFLFVWIVVGTGLFRPVITGIRYPFF